MSQVKDTLHNGVSLVNIKENNQTVTEHTHVFEPSNLAQALDLAKVLYTGGLLPKSFNKPESVVTAIILGRELGMTAMQSIRGIHVIEGKPTLSADTMVALVKRSPVCRYFRLVSSDAAQATYETLREGEPEPTRMSFTIEEARAAGVAGKDNWKKYPAAMLRARCSSALARAVYQDLCQGIYDPDELEPVRQHAPSPPQAVRVVEPDAIDVPPEPVQEDAPSGISDAQRRRLFAVARENGLEADDVKKILLDNFGYESTKQLTQTEYSEVTDRLIPGFAAMTAAMEEAPAAVQSDAIDDGGDPQIDPQSSFFDPAMAEAAANQGQVRHGVVG